MGARRVKIDERNFVTDSCHPKALKKDVQTKNNLIVALCSYIKEELMITQAITPPKFAKKSKPENKKYKKRYQSEEDEPKVLEFVEDEDEAKLEVIPPGGHIASGILTSEQNQIKENKDEACP